MHVALHAAAGFCLVNTESTWRRAESEIVKVPRGAVSICPHASLGYVLNRKAQMRLHARIAPKRGRIRITITETERVRASAAQHQPGNS